MRAATRCPGAFPGIMEALARMDRAGITLDGELLFLRNGRVESFAALEQRSTV